MSFSTAYDRWAGIGPYYAMFPVSFADHVVQSLTKPGQRVLDPFAGRASSIFASAARGRPAMGIEINPVGWVYGKTKLQPALAYKVKQRMDELVKVAQDMPFNVPNRRLSSFFRLCFSQSTLRFLCAAREHLDWQHNVVDQTLMALILVDLHGNRNRSFSNQMRQSKAMSPAYSVNWWRKHRMKPPEIDPKTFLTKKIEWRYAKGIPNTVLSDILLGDSCSILETVQTDIIRNNQAPFTLLFTSPPYLGITDYHRDQWLRLWMLGGKAHAGRVQQKHKGAFASKAEYKDLLNTVFLQCAEMMSQQGYVYIRTDARPATFDLTRDALQNAFPGWREFVIARPYLKQTQTALFGDTSMKPGEKDIILAGPQASFQTMTITGPSGYQSFHMIAT